MLVKFLKTIHEMLAFARARHKVVSSHRELSNVLCTNRQEIRCLEKWHGRHRRGSFLEHLLKETTIHVMLDL